MRFQGENPVDLQNPVGTPQPQHHQLQPHLPLTRAPAVATPGASNGVLLNAIQKDLESKYFTNTEKELVQWSPESRQFLVKVCLHVRFERPILSSLRLRFYCQGYFKI
jgi:hypothetical protein